MENPPSERRAAPAGFAVTIDPGDPAALAATVAAFAALAGRDVRLVLQAGGETHELRGHVPRRAHWPAPDDPCLMLRPGALGSGGPADRTHVLAAMAIHLRLLDGCVALGRRRHYEPDLLDLQRLPPGPVLLRLEALP